MHRIDGPGATVDHRFTEGDPVLGVKATVVTDKWLNDVQEELMSILTAGGVTPVKGTQNQVLSALTILTRGQGLTAFTTAGTAPAFTLTPSPALDAYTPEKRFQIKFHSNGTGTDTINISTLGPKALKQYDRSGNKVAAVIFGQRTDAVYDGTDIVLLDALPSSNSYPPRYFAGFNLANNAGAPNTTIDVSGGSARNLLNTVDINLSALTRAILQGSGAWTAGDNQNKLDTGAKAINTWYHVFAISKTSDGTGDVLLSLSATAPTMPAGYSGFRLIDSIVTDASGNIVPFTNSGRTMIWKSARLDVNAVGVISGAYTVSAPPGRRVMAKFGGALAAAEGFWSYRATDSNAIVPSYLGYVGGSGISTSSTDNSAMECTALTDTSGKIYFQTEFTAAPFKVVSYGWTTLDN